MQCQTKEKENLANLALLRYSKPAGYCAHGYRPKEAAWCPLVAMQAMRHKKRGHHRTCTHKHTVTSPLTHPFIFVTVASLMKLRAVNIGSALAVCLHECMAQVLSPSYSAWKLATNLAVQTKHDKVTNRLGDL
jgi:hypothetical protein